MITGDKLETAKNIGLACNLINADMAPQLSEDATVVENLTAITNSRLINVTGLQRLHNIALNSPRILFLILIFFCLSHQ